MSLILSHTNVSGAFPSGIPLNIQLCNSSVLCSAPLSQSDVIVTGGCILIAVMEHQECICSDLPVKMFPKLKDLMRDSGSGLFRLPSCLIRDMASTTIVPYFVPLFTQFLVTIPDAQSKPGRQADVTCHLSVSSKC